MEDQEVNVYNNVNNGINHANELIPESNVSVDSSVNTNTDKFIHNIIVGEQYDVLDSSKRWCEGRVKLDCI